MMSSGHKLVTRSGIGISELRAMFKLKSGSADVEKPSALMTGCQCQIRAINKMARKRAIWDSYKLEED